MQCMQGSPEYSMCWSKRVYLPCSFIDDFFSVFEFSNFTKIGWKKYAILQVNGTLGVNHVDLFGISPKVQDKFPLFQEAVGLLDDSKFYIDIICSTMKISHFIELTLKQNGNKLG